MSEAEGQVRHFFLFGTGRETQGDDDAKQEQISCGSVLAEGEVDALPVGSPTPRSEICRDRRAPTPCLLRASCGESSAGCPSRSEPSSLSLPSSSASCTASLCSYSAPCAGSERSSKALLSPLFLYEKLALQRFATGGSGGAGDKALGAARGASARNGALKLVESLLNSVPDSGDLALSSPLASVRKSKQKKARGAGGSAASARYRVRASRCPGPRAVQPSILRARLR